MVNDLNINRVGGGFMPIYSLCRGDITYAETGFIPV